MPPPAASAFRLSLLFLYLISGPSYAAEVRVTLPLEGYYRAGRYMPVRVEVRDAPGGAVLRLTGEGLLPTEVATVNGRADGVAPVLVVREGARQLAWSLGEDSGVVETVLRPLGEGQRLVGFTSSVETDVALQLFPDESVIAVPVDPAELAGASAAAWQALDAVVVDEAALPEATVNSLAEAGVVVARRGTQRDALLGWERVRGYDVLRPELLGPRRTGVVPSAFAPVQGWRAELPGRFRVRLLLFGSMVAIAILAAAMVPGRWGRVVIVLVAAVATGSLHWWWRETPAVLTRMGSVWVVNDDIGMRQSDAWTYEASLRGVDEQPPCVGITWPVFERDEDVAATRMRLVSDADGGLIGFRYRLEPGRRIAWIRRVVYVAARVDIVAPVAGTSPMDRLAERMYLRPGYLRAGVQATGGSPSLLTETHPTTVIRRVPPATTGEAEPRIGR